MNAATKKSPVRITLTFERSEEVSGRIVCWVSSARNGEHFGVVFTHEDAVGGWDYKGKSALLEPRVQRILDAAATYCARVYGATPKDLRDYLNTTCKIERGEATDD